MLAWFLGALAVGLLLYGFHPIKRWRYRHLPGPTPRWLVSNLPDFFRLGQTHAVDSWCRQYGPGPWVIWLGGIPIVQTVEPAQVKKVAARPARHKLHNLHAGEDGEFEALGMLFSRGEMWRETRHAWQPFFRADVIESTGPLMSDSAARLCRHLGAAADAGRGVDVWRELGRMTMDVVGTCAFGVDFNTLEDAPAEGGGGPARHGGAVSATTAERLLGAVSVMFETFGLGNLLYGLFFLFPELERGITWAANVLPTATFKRELAARKDLREVGGELLRHARTAAGSGSDSHGGASKRPAVVSPGSFLALVVPAIGRPVGSTGAVLTELWAVYQSAVFILAGYETTANALAFTIYLLAANQGKEAKLLAEIDAWGRDRLPGARDVAAFSYAQAVVQESLRLYPPGTLIAREAPAGVQLGGLDIPRDAALQVPLYSLHRFPGYWQQAEAFLPERFVEGTPEAAQVIPGAHLPFGEGARKCIGYKFAMQEAVLALVALYQQFTFKLLPGQVPLKLVQTITMGPAQGVRVTVHRRA